MSTTTQTEVQHAEGLTIHRYESNGRPLVKVWRGKARKPFAHYVFTSTEKREEWISGAIESARQTRAYKQERRDARRVEATKAAESIRVGTVLYSSWGYDQTNIDYFQVVRKSGRSVWVRPISSWNVSESRGTDTVAPNVGNFTGPETRHIINGRYIRIDSVRSAHPCEIGTTHHQTASGWGH